MKVAVGLGRGLGGPYWDSFGVEGLEVGINTVVFALQ